MKKFLRRITLIGSLLALCFSCVIAGVGAQTEAKTLPKKPQINPATTKEEFPKTPIVDALNLDKTIPPLPPSAEADARLKNCVTLLRRSISLRELLREIGEQVKTEFKPGKEFVNHKIYVRLTNQPVKGVLIGLARLYGGYWTDTKEGYALRRRLEAAAFQRRWWATVQQAQAEYSVQMQKMLREELNRTPLTEQVIQTFAKDIQTNVRDANDERKFWFGLPDNAERYLLQNQSDPALRLLIPTITQIFSEGGIYIPLESLSKPAREGMLAGALRNEATLNREGYIGGVIFNEPHGAHASPIHWDGQNLQRTDIGPTLIFGNQTPAGLSALSQTIFAALLNHRFLLTYVNGTGKSVRLPKSLRLLVAYEKSGYFQQGEEARAETANRVIASEGDDGYNLAPYLPDCLDNLFQTHRSDCLADVPSLPSSGPTREGADAPVHAGQDKKPNENAAIAQALTGQDVSWTKTAGVLLIRNNRWYRNDALEASPETMQELCEALRRQQGALEETANNGDNQAAPTPDSVRKKLKGVMEIAALAAPKCDEWQLGNGMAFYVDDNAYQAFKKKGGQQWSRSGVQPLAAIAFLVFSYPRQCAFYAALSELQRQALIDGSLPVSELNPNQMRLLEAINGLIPALYRTGQAPSLKLSLTGDTAGVVALPCIAPGGSRVPSVFGGGTQPAFNIRITPTLDVQ